MAEEKNKKREQQKQAAGVAAVRRATEASPATEPYFSPFNNAYLCAVRNLSNETFPAMCMHD